jgi:hypothetical protein
MVHGLGQSRGQREETEGGEEEEGDLVSLDSYIVRE